MASYTLRYGRTYDEWARLKASRILSYLKYCYSKGMAIDIQELALQIYLERLLYTRKISWKPYKNTFLDKKPSAFIKNFINCLLERLSMDGYIKRGYIIEIRESISATDTPKEEYPLFPRQEVRITYEDRIIALPTLEYLIDLCTWKDPSE